MSKNIYVRSAKTIEVIEVISTTGHGLEDDPYRTITQYFALDGKLLAERDSLIDPETKELNVHL
jgi:hypothetical protein